MVSHGAAWKRGPVSLKAITTHNVTHTHTKLPLALPLDWSAGILRLQANVDLTSSMFWHFTPAAGPWIEHVSI